MRARSDDEYAWIDEANERREIVSRLACLGTNLAVAAALCRAFERGWRRGYNTCANNWDPASNDTWTPGCGRRAP